MTQTKWSPRFPGRFIRIFVTQRLCKETETSRLTLCFLASGLRGQVWTAQFYPRIKGKSVLGARANMPTVTTCTGHCISGAPADADAEPRLRQFRCYLVNIDRLKNKLKPNQTKPNQTKPNQTRLRPTTEGTRP